MYTSKAYSRNTLPLIQHGPSMCHGQWARLAHWSGLTSPPSLLFLCPRGGGTPAMPAGERWHRSRNRGHPRAQGVKAVPPVVVMVPGVDGAAGGELRSGRWLSGRVVFSCGEY